MRKKKHELSEEMRQYYLDRVRSESPDIMTKEMKENSRKAHELMKKMSIEEFKRQGREDLISKVK